MLDEIQVPATFAIVAHLLVRPDEVPEICVAASSGSLDGFWRGWYESLLQHFQAQQAGCTGLSLRTCCKGRASGTRSLRTALSNTLCFR